MGVAIHGALERSQRGALEARVVVELHARLQRVRVVGVHGQGAIQQR